MSQFTIGTALAIPLFEAQRTQRIQNVNDDNIDELESLGFMSIDDIDFIGTVLEHRLYEGMHRYYVSNTPEDELHYFPSFIKTFEQFLEDNSYASLSDYIVEVHNNLDKYALDVVSEKDRNKMH